MKPTICPYLGLRDDPGSVLDFPSEGNFCHRAVGVPPVSREYQRGVCLSAEHATCPVFLGAGAAQLPAAFTAPQPRSFQPSKLLWLAVPILLILAGIALRGLWSRLDLPGSSSQGNSPGEDQSAEASFTSLLHERTRQASNAEYSPFQNLFTSAPPDPALIPCKQPAGWILYTVKPTDSLYRISLVFGVRIADLQSVNCLEENADVKPGQTIFVPGPPTATAFLSPTPSPTNPPGPNVPAPRPNRPRPSATPNRPPSATPPQPGQPPTATPNPPVQPPTQTPAPPATIAPPPPTSTESPRPTHRPTNTRTTPPGKPTPTSAPPLP